MMLNKIVAVADKNENKVATVSCKVLNDSGVHVLPSGMIVNAMQKYNGCSFCFNVDGNEYVFSGTFSVMDVLMMGMMVDTSFKLEVKGPNSSKAAQEVADLFASGFGEIEQDIVQVVAETLPSKSSDIGRVVKEEFTVNLANGIHFRPASQINLVATKNYPGANIRLIVDGKKEIVATSFTQLTTAAIANGQKISVVAEGLYAKEAVGMVGAILSDSEIGIGSKALEGLQESSPGVVYSGNILYYQKVKLEDVVIPENKIENRRVINALSKYIENVQEELKHCVPDSDAETNFKFIEALFLNEKNLFLKKAGLFEKYPELEKMSLQQLFASYANNKEVDVRTIIKDLAVALDSSDFIERNRVVLGKGMAQFKDIVLDIFSKSGLDIYRDYFEKYNELVNAGERVTIHADNIPEGLMKQIIATGVKEDKIKAIHFEEDTNGIGHLRIYLKSIGIPVVTSSRKQYVSSMYTDTRAVRISLANMKLDKKEEQDALVYALKDCPYVVLDTGKQSFVDISTLTVPEFMEFISNGASLIGNKSLLQQWVSSKRDKNNDTSLNTLSLYLDTRPSQVITIANVNQIKSWCMLQQTEHAEYEQVVKRSAANATFKDGRQISLADSIISSVQIKDEESARSIGLTRLESMIINDYLSSWESEFNGNYDSPEFMKVFIRDVSTIISTILRKDPNAVIRLLDTAPDKLLPFLKVSGGHQRGMDVIKQNEGFYKAMLKVCISKGVNKVLVPMIGKSEDISYVKNLVEESLREMEGVGGFDKLQDNFNKMKVGAMIETPESVVNLKGIVAVADFFSIGGNDLKHLMFGESRFGMSMLSNQGGYSYNVLELITLNNIINTVKQSGKEIGYCGDLHSKYGYLFAYLLFGFNIDYVVVPDSSLVKMIGNLSKLNYSDVESIKDIMRNNQEINQLKDFIFQTIEPVLGDVDRNVDLFSTDMSLYISIFMKKVKSDNLIKNDYEGTMQLVEIAMTEIMADYVR